MTKAGSKGSKGKSKGARRDRSGRRKENAIIRYFRQTWAELKKVRWPSRREAVNLTVIVLAVTVAMSAFLGIVDRLADLLFSFLIVPEGGFIFIYLFAAMVGIGTGGMFISIYAIFPDLPDVDELKSGERREGIYSALAVTLAWFDLVIAALIGLAVMLLGQAIVAYEVFTGATLPRRGFARYWRNAIILGAGYSALLAATTALLLAQPLGAKLQANVTTMADPGDLKITEIRCEERGNVMVHFIATS